MKILKELSELADVFSRGDAGRVCSQARSVIENLIDLIPHDVECAVYIEDMSQPCAACGAGAYENCADDCMAKGVACNCSKAVKIKKACWE